MPEFRECIVWLEDDHARYAVTVTAETLYEAAALGLRAFRAQPWTSAAVDRARVLDIEVRQPTVRHRVMITRLERWLLAEGGLTPREVVLKKKLRALLGIDGSG